MNICQICNSANRDFALRCVSCGGILQQRTKTLDLFSTIYNLWRYPDFTFRKIILAEHKNYTILIGLFEAVGFAFFSLFIIKAGDIYSIDLLRLLVAGFSLSIAVYFPFLYLFLLLSYVSARVSWSGASLKGFMAGMIYSLHPIGLSALVILPTEVAVFGPFIFSNNPSPQTINPPPFYLLGFLDCLLGVAAVIFIVRLTKVLFSSVKKAAIFAGFFFILFFVAIEVTKRALVK